MNTHTHILPRKSRVVRTHKESGEESPISGGHHEVLNMYGASGRAMRLVRKTAPNGTGAGLAAKGQVRRPWKVHAQPMVRHRVPDLVCTGKFRPFTSYQLHEHVHERHTGPKKHTQPNSSVNSVCVDHRRKYPFLIGLAIYVCVTCVYSFACAPWR